MVSRCRQPTLRTMMPALAQLFRYVCSAEAFLRCVVRSYFNEPSTSIFRFVASEVEELRPPGVMDRLSEHPACEPLDVQIFDGNRAVVVDDEAANLVMKVRSLVTNVRVRSP